MGNAARIVLGLCLLAEPSHADGGVALSTELGSAGYRGASLSGEVALSDSLSLLVGVDHSDPGATGRITSGRIGLALAVSPNASLQLAASGLLGGGGLRGTGLDAGGSYLLSSLWRGRRATTLSVGAALTRFWQAGSGAFWSMGRGVLQYTGTAGLRQEVCQTVEVSISYSGFFYTTDTGAADATALRRLTPTRVRGHYASSPRYSVDASAAWKPSSSPGRSRLSTELRFSFSETETSATPVLAGTARVDYVITPGLSLGAHGTYYPPADANAGFAAGLDVGVRW